MGAEPGAAGALMVLQLVGESETTLDEALERAGCGGVRVGEVRLRRMGGRHEALVARTGACTALLSAHDGEASTRGVLGAVGACGIEIRDRIEPHELYAEAGDEVEAGALATLARAASPRAIPLLLQQSARWRAWDGATPSAVDVEGRSRVLDRLIEPPLVAAVGWTNVGKSTLLNALAGRSVSIVADEPGVTRDHVGAMLLLDGLVVRWVDTPGVMEDRSGLDEAAWVPACELIASADVVVVCGDARSGFVDVGLLPAIRGAIVRVGTRSDLGDAAGGEVFTSAGRGSGLGALAQRIRGMLVSDSDLAWAGPWAFDAGLRVRVREGRG